MLSRDALLARAEQFEIDARHARLAAEDAQNPSDREYAATMARTLASQAQAARTQAVRS